MAFMKKHGLSYRVSFKTIYVGLLFLPISLLSGCFSSSPSDVAEEYVTAFYKDRDIEKALELVLPEQQNIARQLLSAEMAIVSNIEVDNILVREGELRFKNSSVPLQSGFKVMHLASVPVDIVGIYRPTGELSSQEFPWNKTKKVRLVETDDGWSVFMY